MFKIGKERRIDIVLISAILLIYISLALWSLPDTGLNIDEPRYMAQAKARMYSVYAQITGNEDLFFCNLEEDFLDTELWHSRCWEGRPKLGITLSGFGWAAAFAVFGTMDVIMSITAHRIPLVLFSAFGLIFLFLLIKNGYNRRAAALACLSYIFIPVLFSFSKHVLLDGASVTMSIITAWAFWMGLRDKRYALLAGPIFGIALTSKIQVFSLFIVLVLWLLVCYRDRIIPKIRHISEPLRKMKDGPVNSILSSLRRIPAFFYSFLLTPVFIYAAWPWIWHNTLDRIHWLIFGYYLSYVGAGTPSSYFMGQSYQHAPAIYPTLLTMANLPVPILIFAFIGAALALKHTFNMENRLSFFLLLSSTLLLAAFSYVGSVYSGAQQFIIIFPFIAMLSGIGADHLLNLRYLKKKKPSFRTLLTVLVALIIIVPGLISIINGHTNSYFNSIVGGAGGVYQSGLFEPAWSGEANLEAVYWLNENIEEDSVIFIPMYHNIYNTYKYGDVGQITSRFNTSKIPGSFDFEQDALLRNDIEIVSYYDVEDDSTILESVNYVILLTRLGTFDQDSYVNSFTRSCIENNEPVYSVMSYGAPLLNIYKTPCDKPEMKLTMNL